MLQSPDMLCFGSRGRSSHFPESVHSDQSPSRLSNSLVDHQGANGDQLPLHLSTFDQGILLIEIRHKFRSIMTAVTFCREYKSVVRKRVSKIGRNLSVIYHSRLWYVENSPLSNRIWNACHTCGAAVQVLFTVSSPYEKPVPTGWSIYNTAQSPIK